MACISALAAALLGPQPAAVRTEVPRAVGPKRATVEAFNRYARLAEARLGAIEGGEDFLWAVTEEHRARLQHGRVVCEPRVRGGAIKVPDGLIHDWVGAVFIPGATVDEALAIMQDYDAHKTVYRPEVIDSALLERDGNHFRVRLRLLKRKVAREVVLETEHDVKYTPLNTHCWRSLSRSTRIVEVQRTRSGGERYLVNGKDHGYLWRLNSYWTIRERDGGVYLECEAISLSRSIPPALAWLLDPIVRSLPREALANTLALTGAALENNGRKQR